MKKFTLLLAVAFCFIAVSCGTGKSKDIEFRTLEEDRVEALNERLSEVEISSVEEIANVFMPKDDFAEGNYSYAVTVNDLKTNLYELTITEEARMDDSVSGLMSVLKVEKDGDDFKVLEIKEAYKCWPNRGHEEWGAEFCR